MQVLSELMGMLQMQVQVYHNAKVCGQWQINEHELGATCFHVVTEGSCSLEVPGQLALSAEQRRSADFSQGISAQYGES